MFEIVYDDGRRTDGRRLDGYTISSPCEPNGSGELMTKGNKQCLFDTPRTLMVNKENDVRIQNVLKAGFLMNQLI